MVRKTCSKILGLTVLTALVAFGARAQQVVTELSDDFQSYGTQANPPGWVDSSVGTPRPEAGGLYKTWPDPLQGNQGTNIVYGTKQASGKPEGNNPRIGTFSTYTAKTFAATGRFEYRGRFIRTNDDSRIGFSVLSSYPQTDRYYLVGLWSQSGSANLSMQLFSFGAGAPSGTLNSLFTPDPNKWYQFLVQVDDTGGKTNIRARFWLDGTTEPTTWSIDAADSSATRLTSGFVGIWSAVKGEVYVDNLNARSPVDHQAPVIQILEAGAPLPEGKQFNRFATPVINVTDDTPDPVVTITLNGSTFASGTQITQQGNHTLTVVARDAVGHQTSLTRNFFIDSIPPAVTLLESGSPFPAGEPLFDRAPLISATTQDISSYTTTLFLDGAVYTPNTPVNTEKEHFISAKSVDALLHETTIAPRKFTVDLFPPVIAVTEGGQPLVTYYDRPGVTPVITVTDATETTKNYLVKEGEASRTFTSGTALTNEARYELAGSATDQVNRATTFGPLTFYIDRSDPVVTISANGVPLVEGKTYGGNVSLSAEVTDLTLDVVTITVDGQTVTLPLEITVAGPHEIKVVAKDKLNHTTTKVGNFFLDLAAPLIDIRESGEPLPEGKRFNRPVTPVISVTDDTPDPIVTITLDGVPFVSGSVVTAQGAHALRVHARDTVGNEAEVIRHFFIDSIPPVVTLLESGNPFPPGEPLFDRPPLIDSVTDDISTYTTTLVLDGATYTPNTPINVEREHIISGESVDALLNRSVVTPRKFTVDLFAPVIAVTEGGQPLVTYYDRPGLTPVITVTDATETTKAYTIKEGGASRSFDSGTTLTNEAKYELAGSATDKVTRTTGFGPLTFYIDRSNPVVDVSANGAALVTDGKIFGGVVTLTAVITDLTLDTTTVTLDGTAVTLPVDVTAAGDHELTIVATDKLGHSTTVVRKFVLDKAPPVIEIRESGELLPEDKQFNRFVTPVITVTDDLPDPIVTISLDGVTFASGTEITQQGNHALTVHAKDAVGNETQVTRNFFIDSIPPVVTLLESGNPFPAGEPLFDRAPLIDSVTEDISAYTTTLLLDGAPYEPNTPVSVENEHVLSGESVDALLNKTTITPRRFTVDLLPPVITVTEGGQPLVTYYDRDVTPVVTVTDATETTKAYTVREGEASRAFDSGTTLTNEAKYELAGSATDKVNRSTSFGPLTFYIDRTNPVVNVSANGAALTDGKVFGGNVTLTAEILDLTLDVTTVTLDGGAVTLPHEVVPEGRHEIVVTATDKLAHSTTVKLKFIIDRTGPQVTLLNDTTPFPPNGSYLRVDPIPAVSCTDALTNCTPKLLVDGAETPSRTPITVEGPHTLIASATDEAQNTTTNDPVTFILDKTPPVLTVTSHTDGAAVTTTTVVLEGGSDDAVTVTVDGTAATVDPTAKRYRSEPLTLVDGENVVSIIGTDAAGNTGTTSIRLVADMRNPDLQLLTPAPNACIKDQNITVAGTVRDVNVERVRVTIGGISADATLDAAKLNWTASLAGVPEGQQTISVEATDTHGRKNAASITILVDRTQPAIEILESGAPFTRRYINRPVSFFVKVKDLDQKVTVVTSLGNVPYVNGASIASEGDYRLTVTATDCAGNASSAAVDFTVDLTPPVFTNLAPANGATVAARPSAITGSISPDALTVNVEGDTTVTPQNGSFSLGGTFTEGTNALALHAVDRAGNETRLPYSFTVRSNAPVVYIREGGSPLQDGAVFNRAVTLDVSADDATATVTSTLNGQNYAGTAITEDGTYTIIGRATNSLQLTGTLTRNFRIDRTGPVVKITSPTGGDLMTSTVTVTGTATDAVSVNVNGIPATLTGTNFTAVNVPLETGENEILAVGYDTAGNSGRDAVTVNLVRVGPGILITEPLNGKLTNRPRVDVAGRVLSQPKNGTITVGPHTVTVDATGAFRYSGYELVEGDNVITATAVNEDNQSASSSVTVIADFTQPQLAIRANNEPLVDEQRFPDAVGLSLTASDNRGEVTTRFWLDGFDRSVPLSTSAPGGHAVAAVARDKAGNETRVERTFFIGTGGGTTGCTVASVDPIQNTVITADRVRITGRAPGAVSVTVAGKTADFANGSFTTEIPLPVEGENSILVQCTDAAGGHHDLTRKLFRVTGQPWIDIISPDEGHITDELTITVSGKVGDDIVTADINGKPAVIAGTPGNRTFTATDVSLTHGINVLAAHARNAAQRLGTDSVRVRSIQKPPEITITAPVTNYQTGLAQIPVSGTYVDVDPATIAISGGSGSPAITFTKLSDTTGTYLISNVGIAIGENTLTVTGRNPKNTAATASVTVSRVPDLPSIIITNPPDNAWLRPDASNTITVSGIYAEPAASSGARVDVNANAAVVEPVGKTYTGTAPFVAGVVTPLVARYTNDAGAVAIAVSRVNRLADPLKVIEAFPAVDAQEVDPGAVVLIFFSAPVTETAVKANVSVSTAGGPVSGTFFIDDTVVTWAPDNLLQFGTEHTIAVAAAMTDVAGNPIDKAFSSKFTTASTAPATPPTVDPVVVVSCSAPVEIKGTAPAGARLLVRAGELEVAGIAGSDGRFSILLPLSGQSGYQTVRVRIVGADGTFSPAAEQTFLLDCSGPYVLLANYDRVTNKLAITFSKPVKASTIVVAGNGSLVLTRGDLTSTGTAEVADALVTVTPADDLRDKTFTLTVMESVEDLGGNKLSPRFDKTFIAPGDEPPPPQEGEGYISGEVYDATTGRPLAGARLRIAVPASAFARTSQTLGGRFTITGTASASRRPREVAANEVPITITADTRGRYTRGLPEGAHTLEVTAVGYTTVWRQIVVPAGAGVIPIDIRLTRRPASAAPAAGQELVLNDGGGDDNKLTRPATLTVPSGTLASGAKATLTAIGAQSIAGLLPLGWSPLASAEIAVFDGAGTLTPNADLGNATLAFTLPDTDISGANQTLSLVRYDSDRDEWLTVVAVFTKGGDGRWSSVVSRSGAYAVVYPDQIAGLKKPPLPEIGAALLPAKDTCLTATTPCALTQKFFDVDPKSIPPTGRAVARLEVNGSPAAEFPSGTAVQAYVTETLILSSGAVLVDPPFAADALLYRNLDGTFGVAEWYLEPSKKAADVVLSEGVDHVEVVEYPGRLDRGTLVGPEGGRVPGDDDISIDIPTGATNQPIHAGVVSLQQADLAGNVDGFKVLSGFDLAMGRSELPHPADADGDGEEDPEAPLSLNRAARATVTVRTADLPSPTAQLILVESLDGSLAGRVRLAAILEPLDAAGGIARRYTTRAINVAELPVDGVIREGRYYVLAALSPIAYATGSVRLGVTGPYAAEADVASFALPANTRLGVTDLTRGSGIFAVPVAAETQGGFAVVPSRDEIGTGQPRVVTTAPARDTVVPLGDLILEAQHPALESWSLNAEQTDRTQVDTLKPIVVTARFSTPIDPNSKGEVSLVNNTTDTTALSVVTVSDRNVSVSPVGQLDPTSQYSVVVSDKLRGLNGAPFGETVSYNFSTRAIPVRNDFDPTKIRITIPVNGVAVITGEAGSVPGNFGLLGVRRDRDFITKPNTQSDNDGKFTLTVGATTGEDRIEIGDLIDLYVIHPTSNAVWARVPLGPFVSPDFKSFVAPKGKTVTFRSADNVIVTVEEGTFDTATIVTLTKEQPSVFLNAVTGAANDVNIEAVARVSFEGEAKKPLILSMPVPAGVQTAGRYFITSELVSSIRGPKIEAITAAGVVNGNFQSGIQSSTAPQARAFSIKPQGGELVVHWDEVKGFLRGVRRPGLYGFMDIRVPQSSSFGWAAVDAIQTFQEIFFDYLASFVSTTLVSEDLGTRVIPVLTNMPLTIVGVDTSSGLQAFKKVYAPLAPGDPGVAVVLEPPTENVVGPFPVFGLPFRAEVYQVPAAETTDDSIRNFTMTLATSGQLTISGGGSGPAIDEKYQVEAFHTRTGEHVIRTGTSDMILTDVKQGDRIVILIEQVDVDPTAQVALTFNEPLDVNTSPVATEQDLQVKIKLEVANEPDSGKTSDAVFEDITFTSKYRINSGNRRVEINPGALRRGAIYRVTLKETLGDQGSPQLFTGSVVLPDGTITPPQEISLYFRVRKPHGLLTTFNLRQIDAGQPGGALRELSQRGNILFVAALDGGLQAYDMSNPAQLGNTGAKPFAMVEPGVTDFWGVATDHHNRVYTVGLTNAHGVIRSYRVEQFTPIPLPTEPSKKITGADQKGNAIVSMRPGYGSGLPQTSATLLSDRPEAIPRKVTLLVQDQITDFKNRAFFEGFIGAGTDLPSNPEWRQYTYTHVKSSIYERQRVTIENISQGLRWSDDAEDGSPAVLNGIIATRGDKLRLYVNERTYGVVPLIGYGFSVFDLLAMESNDINPDAKMTERVVTTRGEVSDPCNQGAQPDQPCHIPTLASTPDVQLRSSGTGAAIKAYALDPRRGLLDVMVAPPATGGVGAFGEAARAPYGLPFIGDKVGGAPVYHPRIKKLAEKYQQHAGRWPIGRFSSLSPHHWSVTAEENAAGQRGTIPNQAAWRDYMIVAGHELGVLIVEVGGKPLMSSGVPFLEDQNLVDVIWTPAAALAVRVIPDTNYAVVLDQLGRVLLIDLSRIDERWDSSGALNPVATPFPTSFTSLLSDNPDAELTGLADPRIIWISPKGYGFGTLPPVIDPDTGMIYTGEILGPKVSVIAALDPKILVKANVDASGVLKDIGGIVPLGVKPPAPPLGPNLVGIDASLAAFRVEVGLPGAMAESLPAASGSTDISFVVESERMANATTEQTPPGFPRAHLRRVNSAGIADPNPADEFKLRRYLPDSMASELRHQKGFNKFVSPWVVGIADFRASRDYNWPGGPNTPLADKEKEGCYACDRPDHLKTADEPDAFEIYTNGRLLSIHADTTGTGSIFDGSLYEYLGQKNRLGTRIVTVMADTMRTKEDLSAAQNPPVAAGTVMGTVYLHSGELLLTERDLSAGGRGEMDVTVDRVYRSRTTGTTPFGQNWESPWFRRLRALPNGHVEYRDETGEIWLFKLGTDGKYVSPTGLFLRLGKSGNGWQIVDQKWRRTMFDQYGRLISDEDQFATLDGQNGNYIRYIYDAEGRLKQIVDPVYRTTALRYWEDSDQGTAGAYPGMIKEVKDWRERKVKFEYDADGRLTKTELPPRDGGAAPFSRYEYQAAPSGLNAKLDGQANLEKLIDPAASSFPAGSGFKVNYVYNTDDQVEKEEWGSGEMVTFTYPGTTSATNNDIYGQHRTYTLTERLEDIDYTIDRQHITKMSEPGITVASIGFGNLPIPTAGSSSTTTVTRDTEAGYNTDGTLDFIRIPGVREVKYGWEPVEPEAPGSVLKTITTSSLASLLPGSATPAPVVQTFHYQTGTNARTFVRAVESDGKQVQSVEPHRNSGCDTALCETEQQNNLITTKANYDAKTGLLDNVIKTGGNDAVSAGATIARKHWDATDPKHKRGLMKSLTQGSLQTKYDYPSENQIKITNQRGLDTDITLDAWNSPKTVVRTGDVPVEDTNDYDDRGRLTKSTRKQGSDTVTTTYKYDRIGRMTEMETDKVNTPSGKMTTRMEYVVTSGKLERVITTFPGGAVQKSELDPQGRTEDIETDIGPYTPLRTYFVYDVDNNVVHTRDDFTAMTSKYDAMKRQTGRKYFDLTTVDMTYDGWNRPLTMRRYGADSSLVFEQVFDYEPAGALREVKTTTSAGTRIEKMSWDGAGRTTGVAVNGRASHVQYDNQGRVSGSKTGPGATPTSITQPFTDVSVLGWDGKLPTSTSPREPRAGATYSSSSAYNALGDMKVHSFGPLGFEQDVDQAGNVTRYLPPGIRDNTTWARDARGTVKSETQPELAGGTPNEYKSLESGAPGEFTDSKGEKTTVVVADRLGRPIHRRYEDGTNELFAYEGTRVKEFTDRQNRKHIYEYSTSNGKLERIRLQGGATVESYGYDTAGRLDTLTSYEDGAIVARVKFEHFDVDGNPHKTTQTRFRGGVPLDEYTQTHDGWNVHGERTDYTMPSYAGQPDGPWTNAVKVGYDDAGNIDSIERSLRGASSMTPLLSGVYRNAGRPITRTIMTAPVGTGTPVSILRSYDYDASNALPKTMAVTSKGLLVAGSEIQSYDGMLVKTARLLGVPGDRVNEWTYDLRGRLKTAKIASATTTASSEEDLRPWDFRSASERLAVSPSDPPSLTFTEQTGHKIQTLTRGSETRTFTYNGAERLRDGQYEYEFDWKGRLIRAEELPKTDSQSVRRVRYEYNALDRVVGRRAEFQNLPSAGATPTPGGWILENRQPIIAADSLPAEVTFAWDPVSDQLVAIYKAGASANPAIDAHGGLVKQIIHGGLHYDDPIEVSTLDPDAPTGVDRLYPIYDETANGNLQVLLNVNGEVVARTFAGGAYGEEEYQFAGAAVDNISVTINKNGGTLESVEIAIRATEELDTATAIAGGRLVAIDGTTVVRAASDPPVSVPAVVDGNRLKWTFTLAEWNALTAPPATKLSIAVTDELRALAWGEGVAVLPPPQWAMETRPLFTGGGLPVELREPIANLNNLVAAAGSATTTALYEVPSLSAAGAPRLFGSGMEGQPDPARQLGAATFHAHPFQEPVTGHNYVRARWYDPTSGTWLTPDPLGYKDSSNLYAFAGGDPVNGRDPTGTETLMHAASPAEAVSIVQEGFRVMGPSTGPSRFTWLASNEKGLGGPAMTNAGKTVRVMVDIAVEAEETITHAQVHEFWNQAKRLLETKLRQIPESAHHSVIDRVRWDLVKEYLAKRGKKSYRIELADKKGYYYVVTQEALATGRITSLNGEGAKAAVESLEKMGGADNNIAAAAKSRFGTGAIKTLRVTGKTLVFLGVAADAYSIYAAEDKAREVTRVVSGWAGAWAGGKIGGAAGGWGGGKLGSLAGPKGTAVGGIIGGIGGGLVGGTIGYFKGAEAGETVYDLVFAPGMPAVPVVPPPPERPMTWIDRHR